MMMNIGGLVTISENLFEINFPPPPFLSRHDFLIDSLIGLVKKGELIYLIFIGENNN